MSCKYNNCKHCGYKPKCEIYKELKSEKEYNTTLRKEIDEYTNSHTLCVKYKELEKAYNETEELLDKQIEATYKVVEENKELKEKLGDVQMQKAGEKSDLVWKLKTANEQKAEQLTYAKTIIQDLLDNTDEYARQRAEDFLKRNVLIVKEQA